MKSGEPQPSDDLLLLMEQKRNQPSLTAEVVGEAARWLKSELKGASVSYHYASCDYADYYGHAVFLLQRRQGESQFLLEIKVAEIGGKPYVFAETRALGRQTGTLFPFFGEVQSSEGKATVLHYISDFLLSTEADEPRREATAG